MATRLADLLRAAGLNVVQSRTADAQVNATKDLTGDGKIALADDLQARVDAANAAKADILVAVHFNGIDDPTQARHPGLLLRGSAVQRQEPDPGATRPGQSGQVNSGGRLSDDRSWRDE